MKDFLTKIVTVGSGISSKRVCGVLGFLVVMFVVVWCTITVTQAPAIIETFIWAVALLLGIDSIVSPFNKKQ